MPIHVSRGVDAAGSLRILGVWAGIAAVLALSSGADCDRFAPIEACYAGLVHHARYELELVTRYTRDSGYVWEPLAEPGLPGCAGRDGLRERRYSLVATPYERTGLGCSLFVLDPESPFGDVPLLDARPLSGLFSASVPYCAGSWQFTVYPGVDAEVPLGTESSPGRRPPVRVRRTISGDCDCSDDFVGEIRYLSDPPDGGAMDGAT